MATIDNPKLYQRLAQAITGRDTDLAGFNAQEITTQAASHGIGPLLYRHVKNGSITGLEEAAINELRQQAYASTAQGMTLNLGTRQTVSLLEDNGLPCLLLKGAPVSLLHYPESHLRPRCDTDLFIDESHVHEIAQLLQAHGYTISGLGVRKNASRQFVAALPQGKNSFLHFDIHYKINNMVLFRDTLVFSKCRKVAQPVPELGEQALALNDIDLLIHACVHRIAHGRNTERNRVIWLYDIHLLAEHLSEQQIERFIESAKEKKVGAVCADALRTTGELFGETVEQEVIAQLEDNSDKEPSAGLINASRVRWALSDLAEIKGFKAKIGLAKELLSR